MRVFRFGQCPMATTNQNLTIFLVPCTNQKVVGTSVCALLSLKRSFTAIIFFELHDDSFADMEKELFKLKRRAELILRLPDLAKSVSLGSG